MNKRQKYFLKQKLMGVLAVAMAILSVFLLEGDATVALFIAPMGLALIFSKDMIWMDNYFFEVEEAKRRRTKTKKL